MIESLRSFRLFSPFFYAMVLRRGGEDKLRWVGNKDGIFSEKSFYVILDGGSSRIVLGMGFGKIKSRLESLSLFGRQLMVGF